MSSACFDGSSTTRSCWSEQRPPKPPWSEHLRRSHRGRRPTPPQAERSCCSPVHLPCRTSLAVDLPSDDRYLQLVDDREGLRRRLSELQAELQLVRHIAAERSAVRRPGDRAGCTVGIVRTGSRSRNDAMVCPVCRSKLDAPVLAVGEPGRPTQLLLQRYVRARPEVRRQATCRHAWRKVMSRYVAFNCAKGRLSSMT